MSIYQLPNGWIKAKICELVRPRVDKVNPSGFGELPYIGLEHIESKSARLLGSVPAKTMKSSASRFYEKDVLYSRLRPYLNKVCLTHQSGICSAEFIVIPDCQYLRSSFLVYRLNSQDFVNFTSHLNTGDRPRVDFDQIGEFEILLPPPAEQTRIVAKLEELLSELDAGIASLQRAKANLKRYRAAVLKAAVEGKLTEEWRKHNPPSETGEELLARILKERRAKWEENQLKKYAEQGKTPPKNWQEKYPEPIIPKTNTLSQLPAGWTWVAIDQISFVVRGASPRPAGDKRYFGGKIPWITVGPLTANNSPYLLNVSDGLTEEGKALSRYIESETLLLTNSGATLGVPKITLVSGCINDGVAALLDLEYPAKLYVLYFLHTKTKSLRGINQGAAQPNLNTAIIKSLLLPFPPKNEQSVITKEISRRLSQAEAAEKTIEQSLARAARLRQSILKRAFEGRLVPQDPDDEPASALLERIRAEPTQQPARRKRRKEDETGPA